VRHRRNHAGSSRRNTAREEVGDTRCSALVRNVHHLDPGRELEKLEPHVRGAPVARRPEQKLVRARLRQRNELFHRMHGHRRMNDQHTRRHDDDADRSEVCDGVIRQLVQTRRAGVSGRSDEQRVAIRRRARSRFARDRAACAGAVFDQDLLAPRLAQFLAHDTRRGVDAAARSQRNDDPDRLCRIGLSVGVAGWQQSRRHQQCRHSERDSTHTLLLGAALP
jgi:hypothetical protein